MPWFWTPAFNIVPYQQAVLSPAANTEISLRLDHQLNAANTIVGRYEWEQDGQSNAGLDTFSLPSRALTNASQRTGATDNRNRRTQRHGNQRTPLPVSRR